MILDRIQPGPARDFAGFFGTHRWAEITLGSKRASKLTTMKNTSPVNQAKESALRTLKDLVQRAAKTLSPETSVQEACDQLRSEKVTSSPVTDQNGQLIGTGDKHQIDKVQ
jgi:CBS-domain-containing membrane protein